MTSSTDLHPPAEMRIQVHPDAAPELDLSLLRQQFESICASESCVIRSRVEEGEDNGRYVNLAFKTSDRAELWRVVDAKLYKHPQLGEPLRKSSMTLCTGEDEWEDYLLLYHFNPEVELDSISEP